MLEYGVPRPYNKNGLNAEKIETEIMNRVFSGELSVEEGTAQIAEEVDAILAESN